MKNYKFVSTVIFSCSITFVIATAAQTAAQGAGVFTSTGSLAKGRQSHTATLLANGKVPIAGGASEYSASFSSVELYDPATGTWLPTGSLVTARDSHTATLLSEGEVLIVGRNHGDPQHGLTFLAGAELLNPVTGIWSLTGSLTNARSAHTATLLPNGKVLVTGGVPNDGFSARIAELYDPASGNWYLIRFYPVNSP